MEKHSEQLNPHIKDKYLMLLKNTTLFSGISIDEIDKMLNCLSSQINTYSKNEFIFRSGESIQHVGLVLSGNAMIIREDYWGNRTILSELKPGTIFGEAYAVLSFVPAESSVIATTDCSIMLLDMKKITNICSSTCTYHSKLIQNMLMTLAKKNVNLTQKIDFMSKKTIRDKLLAYLSFESNKVNNPSFTIPFNRQQLADYLSVDRSALSNEISKLQNEGVLISNKNQFTLFLTN
ncbi:Crp/Fnr family transcriptional regulator [Lachnobacterium bovis]|uniref:cAMP-binding domain of CRP or a regulatory subunit of cAMP-dependent protein kinases n=1 Tax=Lachnobacterium bovis TaxID=140626 RepID=A0A1H9QAK0_9FIRM|nr:Crp/Fnr family transcriptional regulator [Lachnobacterium bovis]SER56889.1 cAMP-binding domain of CRP or a regulatory subunit of cAMP-dependent protein kinases [Lachnobacterium bovis]